LGPNDDQDQFKIYNEQIASIDYVDQSQLCSHRVSAGQANTKKPTTKGQQTMPKGQKLKTKAAHEKTAGKKNTKQEYNKSTLNIDM
jgi:hypothetical protein